MDIADSKYVDAASGIPRVANNEALYKKLLAKFEPSVDIAGFETALAERDYAKAGRIVHAAKGIAGNLSLTAFFDFCGALMERLRDETYVPTQADADSFKSLYFETVRAVKEYLKD